MLGLGIPTLFIIILVVFFLASAIKILNEYERGVIFRLGRVLGTPKGPGLIILIPIIDRMTKVSLRTVVLDIPPQDVITKDNVTIKVNAVVYFRVMDPSEGYPRCGELSLCHKSARADDAPERPRPG